MWDIDDKGLQMKKGIISMEFHFNNNFIVKELCNECLSKLMSVEQYKEKRETEQRNLIYEISLKYTLLFVSQKICYIINIFFRESKTIEYLFLCLNNTINMRHMQKKNANYFICLGRT